MITLEDVKRGYEVIMDRGPRANASLEDFATTMNIENPDSIVQWYMDRSQGDTIDGAHFVTGIFTALAMMED